MLISAPDSKDTARKTNDPKISQVSEAIAHSNLNDSAIVASRCLGNLSDKRGEIRDRSFEQQQYRASGLTLATAAIALWNTVYLERATNALRENGHTPDPALRKHLSPLGWEHVNLTGDYQWRNTAKLVKSKFRPLRQP